MTAVQSPKILVKKEIGSYSWEFGFGFVPRSHLKESNMKNILIKDMEYICSITFWEIIIRKKNDIVDNNSSVPEINRVENHFLKKFFKVLNEKEVPK